MHLHHKPPDGPAPIRAIETRYKGYRFRSRLEARWAVFFDTLGVRYEYEKEGFHLDGERYLPDFWLPFSFPASRRFEEGTPPLAGNWLEIKPVPLSEREERLLQRLALGSRHNCLAFAGDPWPGEFMIYCWRRLHPPGAQPWIKLFTALPAICPTCEGCGSSHTGLSWVEFRGVSFPHRIVETCCLCKGTGQLEPLDWFCNWSGLPWQHLTSDHSHTPAMLARFSAAFEAARSARFEYGETPQ